MRLRCAGRRKQQQRRGMRSSVQRQRASERERTLLREDWLLLWALGLQSETFTAIGDLLMTSVFEAGASLKKQSRRPM